MTIIWHNGAFKEDGPIFQSNDRMRLGAGVFDTMLAVDGKPIWAAEHQERLLRHAAMLHFDAAQIQFDLHHIAAALLEKNAAQNGKVAINTLLSQGPGDGLKAPNAPDHQIVIRCRSVGEHIGSFSLITAKTVRRNEGSPLSRIKSFNYGDNLLAAAEAKDKGVDDAILLNNQGHITCTTIGNIFMCEGQTLITPTQMDGVLDGIVRTKIAQHFDVIERSITPEELLRSDGVYVTNSCRGAVPVHMLDGQALSTPSINIPNDFHLS